MPTPSVGGGDVVEVVLDCSVVEVVVTGCDETVEDLAVVDVFGGLAFPLGDRPSSPGQ